MKGRGARCVLEAVPFPAAAPDAAACAEGSALSWVELPTAAKANGIENCKPLGWLLGEARAAEVMVPLLCLGLHAATRGSAQGSCWNTCYAPAYRHTSVEPCIYYRLIRIYFIKGACKWAGTLFWKACSAALLNEKQNAEGSYISCGPAVSPLGCWKQVAQDVLWKGGTGCVSWLGFTGMTRM